MSRGVFEAALGVGSPWFIADMDFDEGERRLIVLIDFERGSRFGLADVEGMHPVHDTATKRYRHLSFFQYECFLDVRVPRVKLPDGTVRYARSLRRGPAGSRASPICSRPWC